MTFCACADDKRDVIQESITGPEAGADKDTTL